MKIYLDCDGVFADFYSRARQIVGFEYSLDAHKAWSILDKEPRLFRYLRLLPGSYSLFSYVYPKYDCSMLTALPILSNELFTAIEDKHDWVATNLSGEIETICTVGWRGKRDYARSDALLIDDSARNIDMWVEAGGIGIHHTSVWNTIQQLKMMGL